MRVWENKSFKNLVFMRLWENLASMESYASMVVYFLCEFGNVEFMRVWNCLIHASIELGHASSTSKTHASMDLHPCEYGSFKSMRV